MSKNGMNYNDVWEGIDVPEAASPEERNTSLLGDFGTALKLGLTDIPEHIAGLVDIVNPTDTSLAEAYREYIRPTRERIEREYSPETVEAQRRIAESDAAHAGEDELTQAAYAAKVRGENPRYMVPGIGRSAPEMVGSGVAAGIAERMALRGVAKASEKAIAERYLAKHGAEAKEAAELAGKRGSRIAVARSEAPRDWAVNAASGSEGLFSGGATSAAISEYNIHGTELGSIDDNGVYAPENIEQVQKELSALGSTVQGEDGKTYFVTDKAVTQRDYQKLTSLLEKEAPGVELRANVRSANQGTEYAIPTVVGVGMVGRAFNKYGGSVEAALLSRSASKALGRGLPGLGKSVAVEAAEETFQSPFETVPQNLATDKPAFEGAGINAIDSAVLGGAMGAGGHAIAHPIDTTKAVVGAPFALYRKLRGTDQSTQLLPSSNGNGIRGRGDGSGNGGEPQLPNSRAINPLSTDIEQASHERAQLFMDAVAKAEQGGDWETAAQLTEELRALEGTTPEEILPGIQLAEKNNDWELAALLTERLRQVQGNSEWEQGKQKKLQQLYSEYETALANDDTKTIERLQGHARALQSDDIGVIQNEIRIAEAIKDYDLAALLMDRIRQLEENAPGEQARRARVDSTQAALNKAENGDWERSARLSAYANALNSTDPDELREGIRFAEEDEDMETAAILTERLRQIAGDEAVMPRQAIRGPGEGRPQATQPSVDVAEAAPGSAITPPPPAQPDAKAAASQQKAALQTQKQEEKAQAKAQEAELHKEVADALFQGMDQNKRNQVSPKSYAKAYTEAVGSNPEVGRPLARALGEANKVVGAGLSPKKLLELVSNIMGQVTTLEEAIANLRAAAQAAADSGTQADAIMSDLYGRAAARLEKPEGEIEFKTLNKPKAINPQARPAEVSTPSTQAQTVSTKPENVDTNAQGKAPAKSTGEKESNALKELTARFKEWANSNNKPLTNESFGEFPDKSFSLGDQSRHQLRYNEKTGEVEVAPKGASSTKNTPSAGKQSAEETLAGIAKRLTKMFKDWAARENRPLTNNSFAVFKGSLGFPSGLPKGRLQYNEQTGEVEVTSPAAKPSGQTKTAPRNPENVEAKPAASAASAAAEEKEKSRALKEKNKAERAQYEKDIAASKMDNAPWEDNQPGVVLDPKSERGKASAVVARAYKSWAKENGRAMTPRTFDEYVYEVRGDKFPVNASKNAYDYYKSGLIDFDHIFDFDQRTNKGGDMLPTIGAEAAPNPEDKEKVEQWKALSDEDKKRITTNVVSFAVAELAKWFGINVTLPVLQAGGWEGAPNYSISTTLPDAMDKVADFARSLATMLHQQAVYVMSLTPFIGAVSGKMITIKLPDGFTQKDIDSLYQDYIHKDAGQYVKGHSTVDGIMMIGFDDSASIAKISEIMDLVEGALGHYNEAHPESTFRTAVSDGYMLQANAYPAQVMEEVNNAKRSDKGRESGVAGEAEIQSKSLYAVQSRIDSYLNSELEAARQSAEKAAEELRKKREKLEAQRAQEEQAKKERAKQKAEQDRRKAEREKKERERLEDASGRVELSEEDREDIHSATGRAQQGGFANPVSISNFSESQSSEDGGQLAAGIGIIETIGSSFDDIDAGRKELGFSLKLVGKLAENLLGVKDFGKYNQAQREKLLARIKKAWDKDKVRKLLQEFADEHAKELGELNFDQIGKATEFLGRFFIENDIAPEGFEEELNDYLFRNRVEQLLTDPDEFVRSTSKQNEEDNYSSGETEESSEEPQEETDEEKEEGTREEEEEEGGYLDLEDEQSDRDEGDVEGFDDAFVDRSKSEERATQPLTADEARDEIAKAFGKRTLANLEKSGRIRVVNSTSEIAVGDAYAFNAGRGVVFEIEGSLQGVYIPQSGHAYVFANNIQKGKAAGVFLHEVGVHMAASDKVFAEKMKEICAQAKKLIDELAAKGDPVAQDIKRRMKMAGETSNEEAAAYLVETLRNNSKVNSRILQWFRNLKAKINAWLIRNGFRDVNKLTMDDILDVAIGNVSALSGKNLYSGGKGLRAMFSIAWHGSAVLFDKFTLSHIGTGEGGQAHGWGLYFALGRAFAERYRDEVGSAIREDLEKKALKPIRDKYTFLHQEIIQNSQKAVRNIANDLRGTVSPYIHEELVRATIGVGYTKGREAFPALYKELIRKRQERWDYKGSEKAKARELRLVDEIIEEVSSTLAKLPTADSLAAQEKKELQEAKAQIDTDKFTPTLYKVDIPDDDVMLREDAPFSKQPPKVQEALRKIAEQGLSTSEKVKAVIARWASTSASGNIIQKINAAVKASELEELRNAIANDSPGYVLYRSVEKIGRERIHSRLDRFASELLNSYGVKGIRYNGRIDGECAVVWDEEAIKILDTISENYEPRIKASIAPKAANSSTIQAASKNYPWHHPVTVSELGKAVAAAMRSGGHKSDFIGYAGYIKTTLVEGIGIKTEFLETCGIDGKKAFAACCPLVSTKAARYWGQFVQDWKAIGLNIPRNIYLIDPTRGTNVSPFYKDHHVDDSCGVCDIHRDGLTHTFLYEYVSDLANGTNAHELNFLADAVATTLYSSGLGSATKKFGKLGAIFDNSMEASIAGHEVLHGIDQASGNTMSDKLRARFAADKTLFDKYKQLAWMSYYVNNAINSSKTADELAVALENIDLIFTEADGSLVNIPLSAEEKCDIGNLFNYPSTQYQEIKQNGYSEKLARKRFWDETQSVLVSSYASNPITRKVIKEKIPDLDKCITEHINDINAFTGSSGPSTGGNKNGNGAVPFTGYQGSSRQPGNNRRFQNGRPALRNELSYNGREEGNEPRPLPPPESTAQEKSGIKRKSIRQTNAEAVDRPIKASIAPAPQSPQPRLKASIRSFVEDKEKSLPRPVRENSRTFVNTLFKNLLGWLFTRDFVDYATSKAKGILDNSMKMWSEAVLGADAYQRQWETMAARPWGEFEKLSQTKKDLVEKYLELSAIYGMWIENNPKIFKDQQAWEKHRKQKTKSAEGNRQWQELEALRNQLVSEGCLNVANAVLDYGREYMLEQARNLKEEAQSEANASLALVTTEAERKAINDALAEEFRKIDATADRWKNKPYVPFRRQGSHVVVMKSAAYQAEEKNIQSLGERITSALANGQDAAALQDELKKAQTRLEKLVENDNDYVVEFHKNYGAAEMRKEELLQQYPNANVEAFAKEERSTKAIPSSSKLQQLSLMARESAVAKGLISSDDMEALNSISRLANELYLQSLAEESARKRELHRRAVKGYNSHMMENFLQTAREQSQMLANMRYGSKTRKALSAMRKEVKAAGANRALAADLFNEVLKRHNMMLASGPDSKAVNTIMRTTSTMLLITNPAYYIQNLLQPIMMSAPMIAGKHGGAAAYGKILSEMATVGKWLSKDPNLYNLDDLVAEGKITAEEKAMLEELRNKNLVDVGLSQEFGKAGKRSSNAAIGGIQGIVEKVMDLSRKVEMVNRISTALVAYRLERKAGKSHADAMAYTDDVVYRTHGDYGGANSPRFFRQNGYMRILTQFRKFQLIQLGQMIRLFNEAFSDATPEEKKVARKALAWQLGTYLVATGALGTPFAATILAATAMLFGDDGDDDEEYLRKLIGDKYLADLLLHGLPKILGVDLSRKIGGGDMFSLMPYSNFKPFDKTQTAQQKFADLAKDMSGAAGGVAFSLIEAGQMLSRGRYAEAMEAAMPLGIRNTLKAVRAMNSGMTNKAGQVVFKPEEYTWLDAFQQAIGLPSNKVTDRNRVVGAQAMKQRAFDNEALEIKDDFTEAKKDRNYKGMIQARRRWIAMNRKYGGEGMKIKPMSELTQQRKPKKVVQGVPTSNPRFVKKAYER